MKVVVGNNRVKPDGRSNMAVAHDVLIYGILVYHSQYHGRVMREENDAGKATRDY